MIAVVAWIVLGVAGTVYDKWSADNAGTAIEQPVYIWAAMAALALLIFNPGKSNKAYWSIVALATVALLLVSGLWGSSDSIVPAIGGVR